MISQVEDWLQDSDYVDFKDKDNNTWQVGLILSKSVYMFKVRSEGWSSKFDQVKYWSSQFIQIGSNRIQPFRTQVRGYTGQLKNPAVRDHWKFNSQKHQQRLDHLKQFLVQLQKHSRKQITQLLRGEHYFYIDFLMSNTYENEDDLSKIYEYFEVSLAFISQYMTEILQKGIKHFLSNYEEIEDEKRRDWLKSYAHCFYELFDSVKMMFGNYPRHLTFAKNNEAMIKQLIG